jgi:dipeptidyl aminopeptidase/acylaminoacyl peptidase
MLAGAVAAQMPSGHENKGNWRLANQFTTEFLSQYTYSTSVQPRFIGKTDEFWYFWRDHDGGRFWRVDPVRRDKKPLFDHVNLAAQLSEIGKKPVEHIRLPFTTVEFDEKGEKFTFVADDMRYEWTVATETLKSLGKVPARPAGAPGGGPGGGGGFQGGGGQGGPNAYKNMSPDKKMFAYVMDNNLYVADEGEGGKEENTVQLSTDGEQYFSFGGGGQFILDDNTQAATKGRKTRANVSWSEDSKRFYAIRADSRKVGELFLVNNLAQPRPTLDRYKYAMPGEENVTTVEMFAFNREDKKLTKLPLDKWKDQRFVDINWGLDSDHLRMVRRDRLQRNQELIEVDLKADNKITSLMTESVENAYLERQDLRYIGKEKPEFIWWSEKSGWGHFYLVGRDGKMKNPITSGAWRAESIVDLDEDKRVMWITGVGRENVNPYYSFYYRVKMDGSGLTLLTPGDAHHTATLTPSKKFVVDNMNRLDMAPKAVLRDDEGKELMALEETDLSRLYEVGWKMPEIFKVKAADGVTDIYGNMWKPFDFDAKKKYPIIVYVYPGPQTESVQNTFSAGGTMSRLAQLGFIVIQIGNRGGNPQRSNAYHSFGYYNLRDYGLADKKAGIEQLARRNDWIDIDRVGIFGHSGGGFMTAAAMLLPPYNEFFKVGISSSGNHDNNIYNQNWSEQHHGLSEVAAGATGNTGTGTGTGGAGGTGFGGGRRGGGGGGPEGEVGYDPYEGLPMFDAPDEQTKFQIKVPTTEELAPNLKGSLLIVTGDMDNNVHPANSIRLANELIKANKRFDFFIMPGQAHSYGPYTAYSNELYMEYFAEHLLGDYYRSNGDMTKRN